MSFYWFRVRKVRDGDTFEVDLDTDRPDLGELETKRGKAIRLHKIDAAKGATPAGKAATAFVTAFLAAHANEMVLECYGLEKYGRTLGDVFVRGEPSLCEQLLAAGLATVLRYRVSERLSIERGVPVWVPAR